MNKLSHRGDPGDRDGDIYGDQPTLPHRHAGYDDVANEIYGDQPSIAALDPGAVDRRLQTMAFVEAMNGGINPHAPLNWLRESIGVWFKSVQERIASWRH